MGAQRPLVHEKVCGHFRDHGVVAQLTAALFQIPARGIELAEFHDPEEIHAQ
jgi:hypothetical protein